MAPLYAEPRLAPLDSAFVDHKWLVFEREDAIQNTWALKKHTPSRLRRRHSHGGYIPHALAILELPQSPRSGRSQAAGRRKSHEDCKGFGSTPDVAVDAGAAADAELVNDWPSTDDEWEPDAPAGDTSGHAAPAAPQGFDRGAFAAVAAAATAAPLPAAVQPEHKIEIDQGGFLAFVGAAPAAAGAQQERLPDFDPSSFGGFAGAPAPAAAAAPSPVAAQQQERRQCEFDQGGSFLAFGGGGFVYGSPSFEHHCGSQGFAVAFFGQGPTPTPAAPAPPASPPDLGFYLAANPFRLPGALSPPHSNASTAPSPGRLQPPSGPPSEMSAAGSPVHWKAVATLDLSAATSPPRFFSGAEPGEKPCEPPPAPAGSLGGEGVTTLMVRNLRKDLQRHELLEDMDAAGFGDQYDFVYMPCSFEARESKGYAFMNFTTPKAAEAFTAAFHRAHRAGITSPTGPALNVTVADVQGFEANMKKWSVPRSNRIRNPAFGPYVRGRGARPQEPGPGPGPGPGRLPGPVGAGPIGDGGRGAPLRKPPTTRRPRVVGLALEHRTRSPALDLDSMLET